MRKIILASSSPRRKKLLEQVGLPFTVVTSDIEEILKPKLKLNQQVEYLSKQKAEKVAKHYKNAIIIGADTLVAIDGKIIDKPKSPSDAKRILSTLNGRPHMIVTGFTIIDTHSNKIVTKSVQTTAWINMTEKEIDTYVASGEPMGKAGAYAVHEKGSIFIEKVDGDFFAAVGLPVFELFKTLKTFGVSVIERK